MLLRTVLAALAFASAVCSQGHAQAIVVSDHGQRCSNCIVLSEVATLVGSQQVALSQYTRVVKSGNNYVAGPTYVPGQLLVFGSDGTPARVFGRAGGGPGEIRANAFRLAVGPGDSIHVVDLDRWSVFSPQSYGFVRSVNVGAVPTSVAVTRSGQFVIATQHGDLRRPSYIVQVINPATGEPVGTIGSSDSAGNLANVRVVHADADGVWISPIGSVSIDLVNEDVSKQFRRLEGWFPPTSNFHPDEPFYHRPTPRLVGMRRIGGVLLLYATVADRNWKSLPRPSNQTGERARVTTVHSSEVFDGVIEAIDMRSGRVLSRVTLDWIPRPLSGSNDLVQRSRELPDGEVVIDIIRVQFRSAPSQSN